MRYFELLAHAALVVFRTERVATKERVLDVHVFRNWSLSVDQYKAQKYPSASRAEALDALSRNLQVDNPVQFVAIISSCNDDDDDDDATKDTRFAITNGVVGSVDAALYPQDEKTCICLKNLSVDERVRRLGIASALIQNVIQYAFPRTVILMTEDQQNLYARHGFKLQDDGQTMILVQHSS